MICKVCDDCNIFVKSVFSANWVIKLVTSQKSEDQE